MKHVPPELEESPAETLQTLTPPQSLPAKGTVVFSPASVLREFSGARDIRVLNYGERRSVLCLENREFAFFSEGKGREEYFLLLC